MSGAGGINRIAIVLAALFGVLLAAASAQAAPASAATRCEQQKNKLVGNFLKCRMQASAKLAKVEGTCANLADLACFADADCGSSGPCDKDTTRFFASLDKCTAKIRDGWDKATAKADAKGTPCHDTIDSVELSDLLSSTADIITDALAGGSIPEAVPGCNTDAVAAARTCGNGVLDDGETCDFGHVPDCSESGGLAGPVACVDCLVDDSVCRTCADAGGVAALGACYFHSAAGQSCAARCAGQGLVYDSEATIAVNASASACRNVSNAILPGASGTGVETCSTANGTAGTGCRRVSTLQINVCSNQNPTALARDTASFSTLKARVCGCK